MSRRSKVGFQGLRERYNVLIYWYSYSTDTENVKKSTDSIEMYYIQCEYSVF